jgi:hypothetical protein
LVIANNPYHLSEHCPDSSFYTQHPLSHGQRNHPNPGKMRFLLLGESSLRTNPHSDLGNAQTYFWKHSTCTWARDSTHKAKRRRKLDSLGKRTRNVELRQKYIARLLRRRDCLPKPTTVNLAGIGARDGPFAESGRNSCNSQFGSHSDDLGHQPSPGRRDQQMELHVPATEHALRVDPTLDNSLALPAS